MNEEILRMKLIVGVLELSLTVFIVTLGLAILAHIGVFCDSAFAAIAGALALAAIMGVLPSLFVGAFREMSCGVGRSLGYIVGAIRSRSDDEPPK